MRMFSYKKREIKKLSLKKMPYTSILLCPLTYTETYVFLKRIYSIGMFF